MELWILPSAGLQEQTSIKTGSRLLSPSCLVIPIPFLPCWTPIREDSSLNSFLSLCLAPPRPHLSLVSCQALLVYPSLGPRTLSCPRPTFPPHSCLPNHCSCPSRVCPQSLLTLSGSTAPANCKASGHCCLLPALAGFLSPAPPNSPCLLVCLANSLPWQAHQETIILLKAGA